MILRQEKMWNFLINEKISLREYYYLYKLFNKEDIPKDFENRLMMKGLVEKGNITERGKGIILKVDSMFLKTTNKKLSSMGSNYLEMISKYRELFPRITLASGKPARCAVTNLEKAFIWFFNNYDYTWEEIFAATKRYLNENEDGRGKYCKTSQYFIRKDETSSLADMCEIMRQGIDEVKTFKEKVV